MFKPLKKPVYVQNIWNNLIRIQSKILNSHNLCVNNCDTFIFNIESSSQINPSKSQTPPRVGSPYCDRCEDSNRMHRMDDKHASHVHRKVIRVRWVESSPNPPRRHSVDMQTKRWIRICYGISRTTRIFWPRHLRKQRIVIAEDRCWQSVIVCLFKIHLFIRQNTCERTIRGGNTLIHDTSLVSLMWWCAEMNLRNSRKTSLSCEDYHGFLSCYPSMQSLLWFSL